MSNDTASLVQNQSQYQEQTITINLDNSGNPELEHSILSKHGVGRQLGNITAVVGVLLDAARHANPGFGQSQEAKDAIQKFEDMQVDIADKKREFEPEALIIKRLEALRDSDEGAFNAACLKLRGWLDGQQGAEGGGSGT